MQELQITRQQLLRLKKQLKSVKYGKNLLEQKRNALIQELMKLKKDYLKLGEEIENSLIEIYKNLSKGILILEDKSIFDEIDFDYEIKFITKNIMGINLVFTEVKNLSLKKYPIEKTNIYIDLAYKKFLEIFKNLLFLISLKSSIEKVALEVQKTRRRVNILKDIIIPQIENNIKTINLRLQDFERESIVFNLKFKRKKETEKSCEPSC